MSNDHAIFFYLITIIIVLTLTHNKVIFNILYCGLIYIAHCIYYKLIGYTEVHIDGPLYLIMKEMQNIQFIVWPFAFPADLLSTGGGV